MHKGITKRYFNAPLWDMVGFLMEYTPGLWLHKTHNICFTLVEDNFGVKYAKEEDKLHLIESLKTHYSITVEDDGTRYLGMTLDWDYENRKVHVSMPGYVPKALKRFAHEPPAKPQRQPYPHVPPDYGARKQYAKAPDNAPLLDAEGKKYVMQVTGTFLYYARAVDSTMLPVLSSLASEQSAPTTNTLKKVKQFQQARKKQSSLTQQAT